MKIMVLADIHGNLEALEQMQTPLAEADLVLLAGDITNFGGTKHVRAVLDTLNQYASRVLAVPGNCDPPLVDAYLAETGVNLHGRAVCVNDWWFIGAGGTLPELGRLPTEAGERLFTDALERGLAGCQNPDRIVLVTHQPAWSTKLDAIGPDRHAGNRAIRAFIDRAHPHLAVSGHIHDIIGTDTIGPTTLLNPGPAKDHHFAVVTLNDNTLSIQLR